MSELHFMSRESVKCRQLAAAAEERERRADAAAALTQDVRALAASATPRIRPDRSAIVKELKRIRANDWRRRVALDVELIDQIIALLGG